jgi:adenosylcobinamide-phosphate guanylyltransferase
LTVAADLPLLTAEALDPILDSYDSGSLAVEVPTALKRRLGVSVDTTTADGDRAPTGVNVVADGPEDSYLCRDRRLAVNVNRSRDARIAEVLSCD